MKNALVIVTLSSLLTACAGLVPQARIAPASESVAVEAMPSGVASVKSSKSANRGSVEAVEDALPAAELTDDLLFKLLSAEIAFQRGEWQSAYVAELSAAQQTRDPRLARRAAEIALSAKQAGEAMSAVRLWRELAPNSAEATQYYLGFILLGDNLDEAQSILEKRLTEARPAMRPLMILQTQRMLASAKNKDGAFKMLESLVAPYPTLPESHVVLALNAFVKGDAARANQEARAALAIKPNSDLAILTLAQVTPDPVEAGKILTTYLAANPKATEVRTAYARSLVEQKKYELARIQFQQLLAQQPDNLTSLYALGMLGVQTNHLPEAEQFLTRYLKALAAAPDEERDPSQALLVLAQIAEDRNDPEAALKWLAQVDSGEGVLTAQIKRAQIVAKRGNVAEGQRILREITPDGEREQTQLLLAESQILRDADQSAAAFTVLGDALKRYPDNTDLLYDYAMLAEKANNLDVMEKTLRRVMELAPTNQNAYNALGYSFAERNIRLPEAYVLVEKALSMAPEDPFIMDSLGWVQFRLGKLKEAEDLLRRAYAVRPDPEIAVHLGEVLWVKGQKDDAQKLWRDANTKDPKNDTLKSTLARLRVAL